MDQPNQSGSRPAESGSMPQPTPPPSPGTPSPSGDQAKLFAIIGYIVPILFFLPLVTDEKNNPFARYHANQQLLLLLFWVIGQVAASVLTIVLIGALLFPLIIIVGLIFMIMGVMNAAGGKMKPLPLIGKFELIK